MSKSDVNNTAGAIDTAISGLFSQEITEDVELGRLSETWKPGAFISITGCAPYVRGDTDQAVGENFKCSPFVDLDGGINAQVGIWRLDLHCPRISIFDPRDICSHVANNDVSVLDATSIDNLRTDIINTVKDTNLLHFMLSSQVAIEDFVKAQTWYTNFIKNKNPKPADATGFCLNGKDALNKQGLSDLDAALALRAMITGLADLASPANALDACKTLLAKAGVQ